MKTRSVTILFLINLAVCLGFPVTADAQKETASFPNAAADNYISIPSSSSLSPTSAITVEAWINITSATGGGAIVCKGTGGGGEVYSLDLGGNALGSPGTARFYCWVNGNAYVSTNSATIYANTWHHLAGVYNGSKLILYVDGVAGTEVDGPAALGTNTHEVTIGSRQSAGSTYDLWVQGKIDEVRIWNVARTALEIQGNMDCELSLPYPSGLVAYYQFNSATAPWNDLTTNGNNGTKIGNVTTVASMVPEYSLSTLPVISGQSSLCAGSTTIYSITVPKPTGGSVATSGGYRIHTFTSSSTFNVPSGFNFDFVEVLVVAGGGGGAGNGGSNEHCMGSGGAGGIIYNPSYAVTSGNKTVTIGAGGSRGSAGAAPAGNNATNGGNSVFDALTATGGGAGRQSTNGVAGGSGGGGGSWGGAWTGGSGTAGQGFRGGNGNWVTNGHSGGGGGSASAGGDQTGTGGSGTSFSISGSPVTYASGGSHGGGNAAANTGNGGGGALRNQAGGAGGSGVVIVRYPDIPTGVWSSSNNLVAAINASTGEITALSAGTTIIKYTITVNGCVTTVNKTLTVNALPIFSVIKTDITCFDAGNGTITVNASGGTTPYQYRYKLGEGSFGSWTTFNANLTGEDIDTEIIDNLGPEDYTIEIRDNNGCVQTTCP